MDYNPLYHRGEDHRDQILFLYFLIFLNKIKSVQKCIENLSNTFAQNKDTSRIDCIRIKKCK